MLSNTSLHCLPEELNKRLAELTDEFCVCLEKSMDPYLAGYGCLGDTQSCYSYVKEKIEFIFIYSKYNDK